MTVSKRLVGPFTCSECGAVKPDTTTWPQACPACGNRIWSTTVSFSREEVEAELGPNWWPSSERGE